MNVLLTAVGRRSYLVDYFRSALAGRGRVVGANMYREAAGMYAADVAVVTPPADSPEYVPFLLDLCRRQEIGLHCSLHDLDVLMLSRARADFEAAGVITTLPSAEWGRIALDKYECSRTLEAAGLPVPATFTTLEATLEALGNDALRLPIVVKARLGFGSLGLRLCHTRADVEQAFEQAQEEATRSAFLASLALPRAELAIAQQAISGREVCLGILNDLHGRYASHFACEVHAMRAGESDRAVSIPKEPYATLAECMSRLTGHSGIWGVDCLDDAGTPRIIDVNPRFTGDYPFHHLAGADVPAALIAWAEGRTPDPSCFADQPGVAGYKDLVPRRVG